MLFLAATPKFFLTLLSCCWLCLCCCWYSYCSCCMLPLLLMAYLLLLESLLLLSAFLYYRTPLLLLGTSLLLLASLGATAVVDVPVVNCRPWRCWHPFFCWYQELYRDWDVFFHIIVSKIRIGILNLFRFFLTLTSFILFGECAKICQLLMRTL